MLGHTEANRIFRDRLVGADSQDQFDNNLVPLVPNFRVLKSLSGCVFTWTPSSGILQKFLVRLKVTWFQKLSSG